MENKRKIGSSYETIAAAYLEYLGYEVIARNYHCRFGEIDLIAKERGYLVFLEVKYKKTSRYGMPHDALTPLKQERIQKVASVYLYNQGYGEETPCRFDVVTIFGNEIEVIKNAF